MFRVQKILLRILRTEMSGTHDSNCHGTLTLVSRGLYTSSRNFHFINVGQIKLHYLITVVIVIKAKR